MQIDRGTFHVPRIDVKADASKTPVVFLERTAEEYRTRAIERLHDFDTAWTPDGALPETLPKFEAHPWFRDGRFRQRALLVYFHRMRAHFKTLRCCVLIDPALDDGTGIVATWTPWTEDDCEVKVDAVKIDIKRALPLVALLEQDHQKTLKSVLGDVYDEEKMDLVGAQPPSEPELMDVRYEPPTFLRDDLRTAGADSIKIFCLQELDDDKIDTLTEQIKTHRGPNDPDIHFVKWQGEAADRAQLCRLIEWLHEHTSLHQAVGYTFFINTLLRSADDGPQLMAASRARADRRLTSLRGIDIVPLKQPGNVFKLHSAARQSVNSDREFIATRKVASMEAEEELCTTAYREIVRNPNRRAFNSNVEASDGCIGCPTVWFLRRYTPDEERILRRHLSEKYSPDFPSFDYTFMGYVFPDESQGQHAIEDLVAFWQKCDPVSPSFDPSCSSFRMDDYPSNFVAVDDRILGADSPKAIIASTLDWYHPTTEMGWQYGMVDASHVQSAHCNLDIANMGPSELVDDEELTRVWLGDLNEMRQHPEEWDIEW